MTLISWKSPLEGRKEGCKEGEKEGGGVLASQLEKDWITGFLLQ